MPQPTVPALNFLDFHTPCSYEYPESSGGACDGFPCSEKATTFDWMEGLPYCAKHWREMNLDRMTRELEASRG
jgi:hypothetical protein